MSGDCGGRSESDLRVVRGSKPTKTEGFDLNRTQCTANSVHQAPTTTRGCAAKQAEQWGKRVLLVFGNLYRRAVFQLRLRGHRKQGERAPCAALRAHTARCTSEDSEQRHISAPATTPRTECLTPPPTRARTQLTWATCGISRPAMGNMVDV